MIKFLKAGLCCFALSSLPALALQTLTLSTEDGPPHMIAALNAGIDIDITRQVLERLGYKIEIVYAPLTRSKVQVTKGAVDLTVPTFFTQDQEGLYITDPIINYRPTVFTRKDYNFVSLNDIEGVRVSTFQGATGYFGPSFIAMSQKNHYREVASMKSLANMLVHGRTDVVILDYYIFYYHLSSLSESGQLVDINEFNLIPPVKASVGFHDSKLRDQFNQAFKTYKVSGEVDKVIERYIGSR